MATGSLASGPPAGGLDLIQNNSTGGDCPNTKVPYLIGVNQTERRAVIFRPRCKMWACPVCGPANAWVWSFRANDGSHALYDQGARLSFVSITSHEKLAPGESFWVMPKAWMKLQARIRRKAETFEYFAVPEVQDNGRVHIHMITTAELTKKWWKDNGRECGFGYQNDAREVWSAGGVIGYVVKYLAKSLTLTDMPKGTRRVRTSRGWPPSPPREPPEGWNFAPIPRRVSLQDFGRDYEIRGFTVHIAGSRSAWAIVKPDD